MPDTSGSAGAGPPQHPPPPPPPPPGWPPAGPPAAPGAQPLWPAPPPVPPVWAAGSGRFRALALGELLDAVFSLYRRNFLLIAAISAVVQVPFAVLTTVILEVTGAASFAGGVGNGVTVNPSTGEAQISQQQLQQALGVLGVELGLAVLSLLVVVPLAVAATTRAVSDRYLDQPASLGAAYRAAGQRFWSLVAQSCILLGITLGVSAAFVAGLVGGLLLGRSGIAIDILAAVGYVIVLLVIGVRTSLAPPAIVLERLSGWRGLVRSWRLVRGQSWRIFGIRLLIGIITAVISAIMTGLISVAGIGLDATGRFVLDEAAGAIAAVFVNPITYITVTLLYYDTRIRREGFDIEMLARSL